MMSDTFFVSDLHLSHRKILEYCPESRKYDNIDEMNESIIEIWNNTVFKNDSVYILGDVSFGKPKSTVEILKRLNGKNFFLVVGNHDAKLLRDPEFCEFFTWIKLYNEEKICGENFVMMHYPIASWNRKYWGSCHIHGHCHGNPTNVSGRIKDVGWDTKQDLYNIQEIIEEMRNIPFLI